MSETLELAKALIARASMTPEDAGCMDLIVERLQPLGFRAEFFDFGDTRNLWLRRGTSDGRFIAPTGAQVLELGPVNATIHEGNEHVAVADLEAPTAVYERVLEKLLLR